MQLGLKAVLFLTSIMLFVLPTVLSYPSKNPRSILSTRTQYSITKMLLLISTVFILLNLPRYVYMKGVLSCCVTCHVV